ncbi:MAG: acetate--CoA ligase family protein, partial [Pseudomonadota bacterium]
EALRKHLPGIATPCNPQDVTMAAWNDRARQQAIYETLLGEGYDAALMVQNYPREGMWDIAEYAAQLEALAAACEGQDVAAIQLSPMVDCFPKAARDETASLGVVPMQGLEECVAALGHAASWQERRAALAEDPEAHTIPAGSHSTRPTRHLDEADAKAALAAAGMPVPTHRIATVENAASAAAEIGFPVAFKALDARLLHKTEAGALRLNLTDPAAVSAAAVAMGAEMAVKVPDIPLTRVLVEAMAPTPVAEIMASITHDPVVGPVMLIAGGGVQAELWGDSTLLAAPFTRPEIARALDRLKTARLLDGWRGRPAGDRDALLDALEALAACADATGAREIEINPIIVSTRGVLAVDAVMSVPVPEATTRATNATPSQEGLA